MANIPPQCDSEDGIIDGLGVFDTSNLNAELLNGQLNMEINYIQRDASGKETPIGSSLPNPYNTGTTTVIAQIFNSINPTCVLEEPVTFQVYDNPTFELRNEDTLCLDQGSLTIDITNTSETYNYSWTRNGEDLEIPLAETPQSFIVTQGGSYSVTATNPVTGCSTTKTILVDESEIPNLELDDIIVYDLSGNKKNKIEIKTDSLGIGDYEFALNNGRFKNNPIIKNVPPGIHTVLVRDKKGCGVAQLEVSVIGYPYFFTPNGDGTNDTWQILGVNDKFQSSSLIYIFDRHGRLMAQITPDSIGWDGTYNGSFLPADDYWFRVKLEDGRSFTGHFSLIR